VINIEALMKAGYVVTKPSVVNELRDDRKFHLFGYLEPYPKFDFWMVETPEDQIEVSIGDVKGLVFGKCRLGHFVEDPKGAIRLITTEGKRAVSLFNLMWVNENIGEFHRCYMTFLTEVHRLKSRIPDFEGSFTTLLAETSAGLRAELGKVSHATVSVGSFWGLVLYMLESNIFPLSLHLWDHTSSSGF
jgi:hypothetical protein